MKGKRVQEIKGLPIVPANHMMSEDELFTEFGKDGWYQHEDEIYNRYKSTPAKVEIEEHYVGVYKSKRAITLRRLSIQHIFCGTV